MKFLLIEKSLSYLSQQLLGNRCIDIQYRSIVLFLHQEQEGAKLSGASLLLAMAWLPSRLTNE